MPHKIKVVINEFFSGREQKMNKEKNTQVQQKNTKPRVKRHIPMDMGLSARTGTCAGLLVFNQDKSKRDSDFLERLTGW